MEVWKQVVGSERYRVSDKGRVWDDKRDKEVSRVITGGDCGRYYYVNVQLPHGRKLVKCSRLVAEAFLTNPDNLPVVDHINRDKFDDRLENLRWVTYSENGQNRDDSVLVEYLGKTMHIVQALKMLYGEGYKKYYSGVIGYITKGIAFEEALDRYTNPNKYTSHSREVEWDGEIVILYDLLKSLGKEGIYDQVLGRINAGWDVWNSVYNCPPIPNTSISIRQEDGTSLFFSGKGQASECSGRTVNIVNQAIESDWTYQYMLNYQYDGRQLYEINGVSGTREYWYKVYNTTENRVKARMTRRGITFEEALQLPKERVSNVVLNGQKMTVRQMWESFGLDPKKANTYKSNDPDRTFMDTLKFYGVDTSSVVIEEV